MIYFQKPSCCFWKSVKPFESFIDKKSAVILENSQARKRFWNLFLGEIPCTDYFASAKEVTDIFPAQNFGVTATFFGVKNDWKQIDSHAMIKRKLRKRSGFFSQRWRIVLRQHSSARKMTGNKEIPCIESIEASKKKRCSQRWYLIVTATAFERKQTGNKRIQAVNWISFQGEVCIYHKRRRKELQQHSSGFERMTGNKWIPCTDKRWNRSPGRYRRGSFDLSGWVCVPLSGCEMFLRGPSAASRLYMKEL